MRLQDSRVLLFEVPVLLREEIMMFMMIIWDWRLERNKATGLSAAYGWDKSRPKMVVDLGGIRRVELVEVQDLIESSNIGAVPVSYPNE